MRPLTMHNPPPSRRAEPAQGDLYSPHPYGTYGPARPGRTRDSKALGHRSLIRPPWPGAATRDENRWARPSSALGAVEPVATRAIFVSVEVSRRDAAQV